MKVFVTTDMEGVSGCTAGGYGTKLSPETEAKYLSLMMGEINAVVEGCIQAGAREVVVREAHPVDLAQLHPKAKLARGIPLHECDSLGDFDALLFMGQHPRSNLADGVRSHTGSSNSILEMKVNGVPVGETALFAGLWGERGVPTVFLSGDTKACQEASELIQGIVTVPVMQAHNVHGAVCLPPAQTHPLLTDGAKRSLALTKRIKPFQFKTPVTITTEFKYAAIADEYCYIPGTRRIDARTVAYTANDYLTAFRGGYSVLGAILYKYDAMYAPR